MFGGLVNVSEKCEEYGERGNRERNRNKKIVTKNLYDVFMLSS